MEKLYKIGEVASITNMSIKTLRYYEKLKLIKPFYVDLYTGYRSYNKQNLVELYKIKSLKELGFSLDDIRNYNEHSLKTKEEYIKKEINHLYNQLHILSTLTKQKGEKIMKPFINDESAIGKWQYIATSLNKEAFFKKEYIKDRYVTLDELYFLPNGQGYWIFDRWTKGTLFRHNGIVWNYDIQDHLLFVEICDQDGNSQQTMVYKKLDSIAYTIEDISIADDTNLEFINDKNAIGYWQVVDFIKKHELKNYQPKMTKDLWVKNQILLPTGELLREFRSGGITKQNWTKGALIDKKSKTVSKYIIKTINGNKYMFAEWKSGDYTFGGMCDTYYVYQLVK